MKYKGHNSFRTFAAIVCALVVSTASVIGTVGPANAHVAERGAATATAQPGR